MEISHLRTHVTRRNFLRGAGLFSAAAALAACSEAAEQGSGGTQATDAAAATPLLAIIHTNDTHGYDVEEKPTEDSEGNFSMAAVAALKADWEAKGYEVLLVDAGDATQGRPLVDIEHGAPAITFMNGCGYDLLALGNHEFDWGEEALSANESAATFPFVSANVLRKDNGELRFAANKVVELANGTKVGLFGLTTPSTFTSTNPKNVAGYTFLKEDELYDCARAQVDELRGQGCELVVCVGHLGNTGRNKNGSKDVLENVQGIDLFIDGHDHEEVEEEVAGALLVETGCHLHNIGVVAIDEGVPANEPVAYGSYDGIDPAVQAIIDEANERTEGALAVVLGETPFLLDGSREPGLRTQETNLGDFCADAFKWTAEKELGRKVDCAIVNGGAIRDSVEEGDISLKTIKSIMPFVNELLVLEVTGAQLLEALEAAYRNVGQDSAGSFAQVAGISCTIDASLPYEEGPTYPDSTIASPAAPGTRVRIDEVGGREFEEGATYEIATNSFLSAGGDSYYVFKVAADAKQPATFGFDYDAVVSYLVEGCDHTVPDDYAESQGRITILD